MSYLPMVMSMVGSGISAYSQVQQGNAQAKAAEGNAAIASMQAQQVRQAGAYDEEKLVREKQKTLSSQKARYAKSGVLITEGSPIEVMADTAAQSEMDIRANRYNTAIQASAYDYQSELDKSMAKQYKKSGYYGAGATLLSGMGSAMSTYGKKV